MSWQMMSDLGSEPVRTQLKVCLSWEFCCHFSMLKMLLTLPGHQVPAVPGRGLQVTAGLVWAARAPGLGCQGSCFGLPWLLLWATMAPVLGCISSYLQGPYVPSCRVTGAVLHTGWSQGRSSLGWCWIGWACAKESIGSIWKTWTAQREEGQECRPWLPAQLILPFLTVWLVRGKIPWSWCLVCPKGVYSASSCERKVR